MAKLKYSDEFEFQASPKLLFEYISTPVGLSQWFCDSATTSLQNVWNLVWDDADHKALLTHNKPYKLVRFQFTSDPDDQDPSYLQFEIEKNELTRVAFLKVTDYSAMTDRQELEELWSNLIGNLKSVIREK